MRLSSCAGNVAIACAGEMKQNGVMAGKISITLFSDVLCIWAHIAQARVDEVETRFGDSISIDHRFCSVFGDTEHKMSSAWGDKGAYQGFASHLREVADNHQHVSLHPACWNECRPLSSTPAHLALKCVQQIAPEKFKTALVALRIAFFTHGRDISANQVIEDVLDSCGIPLPGVHQLLNSGRAHALLDADYREKEALHVQGSPTFILNDGRQKLYGNVGYGVIEANIEELLKSPSAGSASWC